MRGKTGCGVALWKGWLAVAAACLTALVPAAAPAEPIIGRAEIGGTAGAGAGPAVFRIGWHMASTFPPSRGHTPAGRYLRVAQDESGFTVKDIKGAPGKPLPVRVVLPRTQDDLFRVLMFRGLPDGVQLTQGFALEKAWAVSPDNLDELALIAPEDFTGSFTLEVIYVHGDGDARARREITVNIARSSRKTAQSLPADVKEAMFEKSQRLLEVGDVAGARLVFEYLARHGSHRGAYALAQTYDPEFLDSLSVRGGVRPDMTKALKWYRKAAELGSEPASTRLSALRAGQ